MMEYYLTIKMNEVQMIGHNIFKVRGMNLEHIMLSARSQRQKAMYCMITFI